MEMKTWLINMIDKIDKILSKMPKPLSKIETELIYNSNNIVYERSDLYLDFILTLDDLIETTYLGHDMMGDKDRINHYNWCYNKTCSLVNTENIQFEDNDVVYVYLLDNYLESFYDDNNSVVIHMKKLWEYIFNYNVKKSTMEINTYIDLYKSFETSFQENM